MLPMLLTVSPGVTEPTAKLLVNQARGGGDVLFVNVSTQCIYSLHAMTRRLYSLVPLPLRGSRLASIAAGKRVLRSRVGRVG